MARDVFWLLPIRRGDKFVIIKGPEDLRIDYDDVNHEEVRKYAARLVLVLNETWHRAPHPEDPGEVVR